ncbi:MAG: hypothetical protein CMM28_13950 [Rhodospirillaceae bacterium]|nr:hypothetical protein [Rhodospirillaceae bacterium]
MFGTISHNNLRKPGGAYESIPFFDKAASSRLIRLPLLAPFVRNILWIVAFLYCETARREFNFMIIGIHQPNYIPWLGYFRKLCQSQTFIFYDNVQMPMGKSYVKRCQVKSPNGPQWLTIPTPQLGTPGAICQTPTLAGPWTKKHLGSLRNWYSKSPWLDSVCTIIEEEFAENHPSIGAFNGAIIMRLAAFIGITNIHFLFASEMAHDITGAESILPILKEEGATIYLTGRGAGTMRHLDVEAFAQANIEIQFLDTSFATYDQRHGEFLGGLSVIDAILNIGPDETRGLIS